VVGRFAFVGFTAGDGILLLLLMIASGLVAIGCAFVGIIQRRRREASEEGSPAGAEERAAAFKETGVVSKQ